MAPRRGPAAAKPLGQLAERLGALLAERVAPRDAKRLPAAHTTRHTECVALVLAASLAHAPTAAEAASDHAAA